MTRTQRIIAEAILGGLTSKEAAHKHGVSHRSLQNIASKLGVCFPYGGVGPQLAPVKVQRSLAWASNTLTHSTQTTHTK